MCKSWEKGDLALRFKARFGGFERSGITLAVVWMTQVHGTRRRREIKRGLHIFPNVFLFVFVRQKWRKTKVRLLQVGDWWCKHTRLAPKKRFQPAHGLCKCAYQARGNVARRWKMTIEKNTVLKPKCACQAATTTARKVSPSGYHEVDFWRESLAQNQISAKAIKRKTASRPKCACQAATTTKEPICNVRFFFVFHCENKQNMHATHARSIRRGRGGSTIIFF